MSARVTTRPIIGWGRGNCHWFEPGDVTLMPKPVGVVIQRARQLRGVLLTALEPVCYRRDGSRRDTVASVFA